MTDLPASIEAALQEAGFSGTEIIVMRKLLQEDALTLRELAAKTGKSTGVLDQALKKLLKKGIVSREMINEVPKYLLKSLEVVLKWMDDDTKLKQEMMQRRQQNFETFIRSLVVTQNGSRRPEMEYFEGAEGVRKAYMQVLNRGNDIAMYGPVLYLAEEDPLRDFKVQWFRERQRRGIFVRVITHDTVLGRRFQSRDAFEYRKSILVDEEAYPFQFEKMIVGDTIACFEPQVNRAVFVRYPEYAESERVLFDRLWNKKVQRASVSDADVPADARVSPHEVITVPFRTKTLSSLRDFVLGRRSIAVLACFGLLSASLTYGLYLRDVAFNTKRVQERALSIAATGALQFDAADLEQIHTLDDVSKSEYSKLVYQLNQIRNQNEGVKYAYLMRPTEDADMLAFIADADGLNPYLSGDTNLDGTIDSTDDIPKPGESYDIKMYADMKELFVTGRPTVDERAETDKWGTFLSGYGPIKDDAGRVVALFGVDIDAGEVRYLSANTYLLFAIFVGLFLLFVLVRLMAFNRSLLREIFESLKPRKNFLLVVGGAIFAFCLSGVLYLNTVARQIEEARQRVETIAVTGALQFSASDLDQLHILKDTEKPIYATVIRKLHEIYVGNSEIKYVYLIRPKPKATTFEFIADAEAYGINLMEQNDINQDGIVDSSDETPYPGLQYDIGHIDVLKQGVFFSPMSTPKPYADKWGSVISGYAPIKKSNGEIAGLLAIDMDAKAIYIPTLIVFAPIILYGVVLFLYFLCWSPGIRSSLFYEIAKKMMNRKFLTSAGLVLVVTYWVVFGLYVYTEKLLTEQAGRRLMAIASTAVLQINPDDLENLRFARDMKSPEYQRVFNTLNDIRNKNPEIIYAYILRPTETDGMWEFVVDADGNYYIPFDELDYTGDGITDEADENVSPGVHFDIAYSMPKIHKNGLNAPVFEDGLITNQWGTLLTGSAPIFKNGKTVAILALDVYPNSIWRTGFQNLRSKQKFLNP